MHGHFSASAKTHDDDGGGGEQKKKQQQQRWGSVGSLIDLNKEYGRLLATSSAPSPIRNGSRISLLPKEEKCNRSHITEEEKEEIQKAFQIFDTRNAGKLSYRELKMALRALDFSMKKDEVKKLMHDHAKDGNATELDSQQFFEILTLKYKERDKNQDLIKAFISFDEEGKGSITFKNLKKVARDLGEQIDDEEIQAMIDEFDMDGDGKINEEEFLAIMRSDDDFDDSS